MEALQTDVMRFMAILGLCLAAIFSLVKSPDFDPPPTKVSEIQKVPRSEVREVVTQNVIEEPVTELEQEPQAPQASRSRPAKQTELPNLPEEEGFVLEFESAGSLSALIDSGRVTLVVSDSSAYWSWAGGEGPSQMKVPPAYYAMEEHTVPSGYRLAAEAKLGPIAKIWGVVLPTDIIDQISGLVNLHSGGVLAISSSGAVNLERVP